MFRVCVARETIFRCQGCSAVCSLNVPLQAMQPKHAKIALVYADSSHDYVCCIQCTMMDCCCMHMSAFASIMCGLLAMPGKRLCLQGRISRQKYEE